MNRILVVEDDSSVRLWLSTTLSAAGYTVTVAGSLTEARSIFGAGLYDVVVVDWKLPDGSGALLAREAQASGSATLMISGFGLSLPQQAFDEAACLWKPFGAEDLLRGVEKQIALRSARSSAAGGDADLPGS